MNNCLIQTPLFGDKSNVVVDDLSTAGWPSASVQSVEKITSIRVYHGEIVDKLTINYGKKQAVHGSSNGNKTTPIQFKPREYLIGIYGRSGLVSEDYGPTSIYQLQFVILDKETGKVRTEGPFGTGDDTAPFTPIYVTNNVVGFSSNVTEDKKYIQALSFWTNFVDV